MEIGVHKVATAAPSDVSELERLIEAGAVDPAATLSYQLMLGQHLGCTAEEVGRRIESPQKNATRPVRL